MSIHSASIPPCGTVWSDYHVCLRLPFASDDEAHCTQTETKAHHVTYTQLLPDVNSETRVATVLHVCVCVCVCV